MKEIVEAIIVGAQVKPVLAYTVGAGEHIVPGVAIYFVLSALLDFE